MKITIAAFLSLLLLGFARPVAAESDPAAPIHLLCDTLIDAMKQGKSLSFHDREAKLRPVVTSVYDMAAMTRSTLGLTANKLSPDELAQLAEAYGRYSVATYADQFNNWGGERFEIEAPRKLDNGATVVPSFIIGGDGSRTGIDYVMRETDGKWRIVDVLFGGSISQVAVRRSEFVPIVRVSGVAGLISMLDGKAQAMEKK